MDKISGILPSSARVTSVDMKEAGPVRPGTPNFGRPEGASALRDAKLGATAGRAAALSREQLDWRSKDMQNAAAVREISDRFFKGNEKTAHDQTIENVTEVEMNRGATAAARPSTPSGFDIDALDRTTGSAAYAGASAVENAMDEATSQPDGLHARGSFIDVRA
ncbi:hypothetical protein BH10BDE1_BH10BDE1_25650 [soil metagenome]